MPVTISSSSKFAGRNRDETVDSEDGLLQKWKRPYNRLVQSSFCNLDPDSKIIPYRGGVVKGIIRASQQHLHLVLRTDDIWLSILTQFSRFVNASAEGFRPLFVAPQGRLTLKTDVTPQSPCNVETGRFAQDITRWIQENVVDVELRDWVIPDFTTTTDTDRSVAAIVMMGTPRTYFDYEGHGGWGFPSVTLSGERWDWEQILDKVHMLPKYGSATEEWGRCLTPIIKLMIESFDVPNSQRVKDFWLRAHHSAELGAWKGGPLSGWVTAFCFWSDDGSRTKDLSNEDLSNLSNSIVNRNRLILDGVTYPIISTDSIPQGVVSVLVTLQHIETELQHETQLFGGCVGMTATTVDGGEVLNKVQPRSAWWMVGHPSSQ